MATAKTSAAAKRAAAESAPTSTEIEFLGEVFTGPKTLPATFAFDAMAVASGNEGALMGIIASVLGSDQLAEVRNLLVTQDVEDGGAELLGELFNAITSAYGVDEGE